MSEIKETGTAQPQQDIATYLDAPCEVRMLEREGRFVLSIPELGLAIAGTDLPSVHAELRQARERRLREFAAEGILHWLSKPGSAQAEPTAGPSLLRQLRPFLIKAGVVTLLFLGASNVISNGLRDTGYVLEKKLDALAHLAPESVEKNRLKAAQIAVNLRPIMQELLKVTERPAAPASDNTTEQAEPLR